MWFQILVACFAVFTAFIVRFFKRKFQYWEKRNVFTLPPNIPFGNAKRTILLQTSAANQIADAYREFKSRNLPYGGYYAIFRPIFIPVDIQLIRNMITTDFQYFTDHNPKIDEENDPLSGHLFSQTGAKWKALRIKLTPTFTTGKLKMMFPTLVECTEGLPVLLSESERKKESVDIKDAFARYTTDVIASIAFGIECNCLKDPDAEFRKWGKRIFETNAIDNIKRLLRSFVPLLAKVLRIPFVKKDIERFFIDLVNETALYRDKNKVERKDFMQLLLNLRHTELKVESRTAENNESNGGSEVSYYQNGLTMNEIAAQAFVFFIAGYETSSTTLNFLMYELVSHPEIQEKLRKEIDEVLSKYNGQITYEALNEMTYLDKCVLETLRKYPPVPVLPRQCTRDYKIPNTDTILEKGTQVSISAYGIHHDPEYYPEPEKFDPERFSEENKSKRPPMTFLAFGDGPRICIGLRLGVLQTKVGLVAMLRKFKFTLSPKTKTPLIFDPLHFILYPKGGIWVDPHKI